MGWSNRRADLVPIYIAIDQSESMTPHTEEVRTGLLSVFDCLQQEGDLAAITRLGLVTFNERARARLRQQSATELAAPPVLDRPFGKTYYSELFAFMETMIAEDIEQLRATSGPDGRRTTVGHPLIFVVTDGYPTFGDDWRPGASRLIDRVHNKYWAQVICAGVSQAQEAVLKEVAGDRGLAITGRDGVDVGRALIECFRYIANLLITTLSAGADDASQTTHPTPPPPSDEDGRPIFFVSKAYMVTDFSPIVEEVAPA